MSGLACFGGLEPPAERPSRRGAGGGIPVSPAVRLNDRNGRFAGKPGTPADDKPFLDSDDVRNEEHCRHLLVVPVAHSQFLEVIGTAELPGLAAPEPACSAIVDQGCKIGLRLDAAEPVVISIRAAARIWPRHWSGGLRWCREEESNLRPPHYECGALPTELSRRPGGSIGKRARTIKPCGAGKTCVWPHWQPWPEPSHRPWPGRAGQSG